MKNNYRWTITIPYDLVILIKTEAMKKRISGAEFVRQLLAKDVKHELPIVETK